VAFERLSLVPWGRAMDDWREKPASPASIAASPTDLAPADYCDPVIEAYKKDVDRTLLRENLKLSVEQRLRKAQRAHASVAAWREAGKPRAGTSALDLAAPHR
jgi:hypothetical protein